MSQAWFCVWSVTGTTCDWKLCSCSVLWWWRDGGICRVEWDSSQFSGKLTSSWRQRGHVILPLHSLFCICRSCGITGLKRICPWHQSLVAKNRKVKNSAQAWERLKHITKLTGFKDIFLTSKCPCPPPTCLTHSLSLLYCLFSLSGIKISIASWVSHSKPLFHYLTIKVCHILQKRLCICTTN